MDRFFELLKPFIRGIVRRPGWVLAIAFVVSAAGFHFASRLAIDTDLANLVPESYPSAQALEKLRETVGGESEAAVAIESPSFDANRAFAESFIAAAEQLSDPQSGEAYFTRIDYRKDVSFMQNNALYFATPAELDMLQDFLDDKIEEAALDANPFFFDLDDEDDDQAATTDSIGRELEATYEQLVSREYPVSDDSTTLVVRLYPSGAQSDLEFIRNVYQDLDSLAIALKPVDFHPEMKVTTAGRLLRQLTEVETIRQDVLSSFGSGIMVVLLMVVLYFFYKSYRAQAGPRFDAKILTSLLPRIPLMALIIGLPLLMSLSWTFGIAYLAYEKLNLMTSTLGLVLFGLGIDYGIHFFARYSEERATGKDLEEAAVVTFTSTGQAITVGALTTAAALFVLTFADFRGFSQFGLIAGTGIVFALVAMLVVMPALITVFERSNILNLTSRQTDTVVASSDRAFPAAKPLLAGSLIAVVVALFVAPGISFEYRFGELEPVYEDYNNRHSIVRRVYNDGRTRNPAYFVVDTPEEVPPIVDALNLVLDADTTSPTVKRFESLQDRFPMTEELQQERLYRLADVRDQLSDPFLEADTTIEIQRLRSASSTNGVITFEQIPDFLRAQFTSKTGELGNFVIIYPSVGLSDARQAIAFSEDIGQIVTADGRVYHAGSLSLVAADMIRLMKREAPWMVIATFLIVALLMYVNFRSVRWMLLALLPLVVGILWMLLVSELVDLRLNFYNLIVLPAILGIGNDAGVHLVHRYREEGRGSMRRVALSTGEHVTMGSLTTMMGFAGLLLSFHPGLNTIGQLAVIGIGSTLVAALFFLPALIQWLENRDSLKEKDIL